MNPRAASLTTLGGEVFSGAEAAAYGLVTTAVPGDRLDAEVARVCAPARHRRRPGAARVQADPQPRPARPDRRPRRGDGGAERPAVRLRRGPRGDDGVPLPQEVLRTGLAARELPTPVAAGRLVDSPDRPASGSARRAEGTLLTDELVERRDRRGAGVRRSRLRPAGEVRAPRGSWPARATAAAGSVTRVGWSSATRWCSRRRSGSPSSTPPTRVWSSAGSTCGRRSTREPRYIGRIGLRDDAPRLAADRLAGAGGRRLLPGHGRRARSDVVRRRVLRCAGPDGRRRRGRAARRRGRDRPADRRRGRADGPALPGPRPVDALDRGHHPGRAGQGDPRAGQGRRGDQRRPRHRQDGRRAAPRGVPALHRPPSLRDRRRPRRRPVAASSCATSSGCCRQPRRDRGRAALARRGRRRRCARPATTPRRSPTSRARPGWPS